MQHKGRDITNADPFPPAAVLAKFNLTEPVFVAETALARVWKAQRTDGIPVALKVYFERGMRNEADGFRWLKAMQGAPVVQVYGHDDQSAVIEWLDGPSLGDLSRSGNDTEAAMELGKLARTLHSYEAQSLANLPDLEDWFAELFTLGVPNELSDQHRRNFEFCIQLATTLLSDQKDIRPLHGDLHHDNVKLGSRGYTAFDAKGVLGERTYDLANAFRNPKGARPLVYSAERIANLRDTFSTTFEVSPSRLMQWAVVKCALSIAWRHHPTLQDDDELELLDLLIGVLNSN
ncbi:MAG: aminoglycoside phosphotransferase family protein [Pseudomonadota bacterium]